MGKGRRCFMHMDVHMLSDLVLHDLNLRLSHMDGLLHNLEPRLMPDDLLDLGYWHLNDPLDRRNLRARNMLDPLHGLDPRHMPDDFLSMGHWHFNMPDDFLNVGHLHMPVNHLNLRNLNVPDDLLHV